MILRDRTERADFLILAAPPTRHFERSRPTFFFRIRSCECVGLRREKSLFSSCTTPGPPLLTRSRSIFISSTALVALGFPPNCGGPDDVCREAQHLSLLRQEAQETHHEVGSLPQHFRDHAKPHSSFRAERADLLMSPTPPTVISSGAGRFFSPAFAPANASACVERNSSSLAFRI